MSEPDIADDEAEFQAGLDEIFHAAHRKSVRVLASGVELSAALARAEAAEARLAVALEALDRLERAVSLYQARRATNNGSASDSMDVTDARIALDKAIIAARDFSAARALGRGDGRG